MVEWEVLRSYVAEQRSNNLETTVEWRVYDGLLDKMDELEEIYE